MVTTTPIADAARSPTAAAVARSGQDLPITPEGVLDAAATVPLKTVNENDTAMHVNTTDSWIVLADASRRACGFAQQTPRREAEAAVRNRAAELSDQLFEDGCRFHQVAERLHLPRRTLSRWRRQHRCPHPALPRGRPCKESTPTTRRAVLQLLQDQGAHLGLPTLQAEFPDMPRVELQELQAGYRRCFRATHRRAVARLTWHEPGTVWATDHVVPTEPIDGVQRATLAARDLVSGMQLAWEPVPDQAEPAATATLESLFAEHGPPLVLKSDNGSAFTSGVFQAMLVRYGVTWLPSPPRQPRYNGGCEAGNGSLRKRTEHFARRAGGWTSGCLRAACRQANELIRPQGHHGATHRERWAGRKPIDPQLRDRFLAAVARHRQAILNERYESFNPKNKNHQRQVQRQAAVRALLELDLLTINRRSIPLPINPKKWAKFS
jgi:transposase InsO family protein